MATKTRLAAAAAVIKPGTVLLAVLEAVPVVVRLQAAARERLTKEIMAALVQLTRLKPVAVAAQAQWEVQVKRILAARVAMVHLIQFQAVRLRMRVVAARVCIVAALRELVVLVAAALVAVIKLMALMARLTRAAAGVAAARDIQQHYLPAVMVVAALPLFHSLPDYILTPKLTER